MSCGLGSWRFPRCRRASVGSCFGCAQLYLSLWSLLWRQISFNWSCKVLVRHSHKTPQKGFLPYLQLKESAQIDSTALIQVLLEKTQADKSR